MMPMTVSMAMLQRRFASSIRAARPSLERMRDKRQKILGNPAAYRQQQIDAHVPDGFDLDPMPAADLERIEGQILQDDELFAQVVAIEQELLDTANASGHPPNRSARRGNPDARSYE